VDFILEMNNITKQFPGVLALDDVSLDLKKGEILALLGENGAGKSTLMKILAGALVPDTGEIIVDGEKIEAASPIDMLRNGVSVVYQELSYLDNMSVAENIYLGDIPVGKLKQIDKKKLKENTKELLKTIGLNVDPMVEVSKLSIAQKQMLEIAKALSKNSKIVVLDEPTSALNDAEIKTLFGLLRELSQKGIGIIYISHKMEEIFEISERVQVLRDGKHIDTVKTDSIGIKELVSMMVGRTITDMYPKEKMQTGDTMLEIENLTGASVHDVSFKVRSGEILGLFGLLGSGRTEIAESIFGRRLITGGTVKIMGQPVVINSPEDAIKLGIAYIPRERKTDGLIITSSLKHNMSLVFLKKLMGLFKLNNKLERKLVGEWIEKLSIKTPSAEVPIESLSGGNQQKSIIGKWMINSPKILIMNEPTRGVDVGAKVEIYKLMESICREGKAIIMISSETPEIMGISDRIIVIHEGRVNGEMTRDEFDQEKMMYRAIGGI